MERQGWKEEEDRLRRKLHLQPCVNCVGLMCLVVGVASWLVFSNQHRSRLIAAAPRAIGEPQLVSTQPLPVVDDGTMCQWMPASAGTNLISALSQQEAAARVSDTKARTSSFDVDRAPARVIRDTFPTYSAVALDPTTNEIYLQDENLFGLLVYDRMTNTPSSANFSEPKRRVRGEKTRLEFNCSVYVDPKNGEVYSINNDMVNQMVVFPRGAAGDVSPLRLLHTPHRTFGIMADEEAQELYLTVQSPPQVVVYRKTAAGEEKPLRTLEGPHTLLEDAHGIALDRKNNWMFVSNHGSTRADGGRFDPPSITVYPLTANGDIAPLRTIAGPKTGLNWPALMTLDQERGDLYVANDMGDSILIFRVTDSGNVAPTRIIQGAKTGLKNPTGLYLDRKNNELWVSSMGNHSAAVYPLAASGDAAPLRTIRSSPANTMAQMIGNPGAVGYDTKREEVLVPN